MMIVDLGSDYQGVGGLDLTDAIHSKGYFVPLSMHKSDLHINYCRHATVHHDCIYVLMIYKDVGVPIW